MKKILFLARQFNTGGAQRQILELLKGMDKIRYKITVLTFYEGGQFEDEVINLDQVEYICLDKKGRWDLVGFIFKLISYVKKNSPDVLYSYLGAPNLTALIVKVFIPKVKVVWGIRSSKIQFRFSHVIDFFIQKLELSFIHYVDCAIANSMDAQNYFVSNGLPKDKILVIPNAIDVEKFFIDKRSGEVVRSELGILDSFVIGIVGRIHPKKGYEAFLRAARLFCQTRKNVVFLCVGSGSRHYLEKLVKSTKKMELSNRVKWLGKREDMTAVYNALDIFTSSSVYGEGFSNAIGEAMACGVPCVVTDVGDSARIVGDFGVVVEPNNPRALALGWECCIGKKFGDLKATLLRKHVVDNYNYEILVRETEKIL